jgi:hypothetical protein
MAIVFNGTTLNWYTNTIIADGTTVSSPTAVGDVYFGGTKVHGLSNFSSETQLYNFGLAPDSSTFENTYIPALTSTYSAAFEDYAYETGPGSDTRWYYNLYEGYRMVTSDGTFAGGENNLYWDGKYWTGYLWEGRTVTGANTSHNGGTSVSLRRDNGI